MEGALDNHSTQAHTRSKRNDNLYFTVDKQLLIVTAENIYKT